ncbi:hypothetical protein MKZ17_20480 [Solibacillus sp. FSL R7-0682]|uniref:hypothetical protein n=1 Tax=Bacillales TaxID=1385 RepID=UPI0030F80444
MSKDKWNRGAGKYPDKRSIISEIWRRYREGLPLNYNAIHTEDDALRRRCTSLFGGYRYAVEAAGFTYSSVRIDTDMASYYGNVFESLLCELFTELKLHFEQYAHSKYNPDFVLSNNRWVDAKLSEWTVTNRDCDTVQKYEPYCKSLTIVYLRGRDNDRMITCKTRLIHVNRYIKQLPRHKRGYFYAKVNEIERKLNEVEAS